MQSTKIFRSPHQARDTADGAGAAGDAAILPGDGARLRCALAGDGLPVAQNAGRAALPVCFQFGAAHLYNATHILMGFGLFR